MLDPDTRDISSAPMSTTAPATSLPEARCSVIHMCLKQDFSNKLFDTQHRFRDPERRKLDLVSFVPVVGGLQ
jgi:hypothetical protein